MLLLTILGFYFVSSTKSVYLSPCAKWNMTAITVVGNGLPGSASDQLNRPQGIFFSNRTNTLYIADSGNQRIQMVSLNSSSSTAIIFATNIDSMSAIYVDDEAMAVYVARRYDNRVEKWLEGATDGEQIGDQCKQCTGVWLDDDKNVYMTASGAHTVLKWFSNNGTSVVVAGRSDEQGQTNDRLYFPRGIFIHRTTGALYVADTMNNRIQKWNPNANEGQTVAGSKDGTSGYDSSKLASPMYVWLEDDADTLYIVDSDNDRIQRWKVLASAGTTIVGGEGRGKNDTQLSSPNALVFDDFGNLYVCDGNNHRVQMFMLIANQTCPPNPSHSTMIAPGISFKVFIFFTGVLHLTMRLFKL